MSRWWKKRTSAHPAPGEHEIQDFLLQSIASTLQVRVDELDVRRTFADYGLDSMQMVSLSGELEEFLQRRIPEVVAWDYPTIEALARYLSGGEQPPTLATEPVDLTESLR